MDANPFIVLKWCCRLNDVPHFHIGLQSSLQTDTELDGHGQQDGIVERGQHGLPEITNDAWEKGGLIWVERRGSCQLP